MSFPNNINNGLSEQNQCNIILHTINGEEPIAIINSIFEAKYAWENINLSTCYLGLVENIIDRLTDAGLSDVAFKNIVMAINNTKDYIDKEDLDIQDMMENVHYNLVMSGNPTRANIISQEYFQAIGVNPWHALEDLAPLYLEDLRNACSGADYMEYDVDTEFFNMVTRNIYVLDAPARFKLFCAIFTQNEIAIEQYSSFEDAATEPYCAELKRIYDETGSIKLPEFD